MVVLTKKVDVKLKQYEATVEDFVKKKGGHFIVASADNSFLSVMRGTLTKHLVLDSSCMVSVNSAGELFKELRRSDKRSKQALIFVERMFNEVESVQLVKDIKNQHPKAKIIILTHDAERQRLVLMHEIGADNFISKPISINNLIEKIAFTVKPQNKIGQIIEAGKALVEQGKFPKALAVSEQILEIKPNSAAAYLIQGDAYRGMNKRDEAVEAYETASQHAPMYLEPLKKLSTLYLDEDNLGEHLRYLEKLDALSPLNIERKVDIGGVHLDLGNAEKAETMFSSALGQAKRQADSYIEDITRRIGDKYASKHPEKAAEYYRKALEAKGKRLGLEDIKTFNMLGLALRKQGKWLEAIDEYKKAKQISPNDENIYYNMAMAFAEGKDFEKAYKNLLIVLKLNPDFYRQDATLAYNLGLIFARVDALAQARTFVEHAVDLNPEFHSAKRLLETLPKG